jgi:hypothetical protein
VREKKYSLRERKESEREIRRGESEERECVCVRERERKRETEERGYEREGEIGVWRAKRAFFLPTGT